jgi:lipoprotein
MKTICVFIFIGLICVISGCFIWMVQNSSAQTVMLILYILVSLIFIIIYDSCEESNQQTAKKTATNVNQTTKKITPVQSNTEPVTYSTYTTYSHQNNTSAQSDITPTKQYPVLGEIQKIISNLTELEKDNDLDKNMFAKFHKLKEQFDLDYQKTIKILNKLDKFKPIDEKHLKVFNHYLDLFKEEKDYIYKQIEQNYDNEIDAIYNNLDNIND